MKFKNVVSLDYKNKEHICAVTKLHTELLPESVVSQLGNLFMKKFYYTRLTKDGLIGSVKFLV